MRLYTLGDRFNLCGERVREARMRMGWSQEELAAKLQLAGLQLGQMAVSRIETGKRVVPDFELPILAEVLRVRRTGCWEKNNPSTCGRRDFAYIDTCRNQL